MKHTFLFQEGLWIASGNYIDAAGDYCPVKGHSRVTHGILWNLESYMQLMREGNPTFQNEYEVQPCPPDNACTSWTSRNPAIGTLHGRFIIVDDAILSIYAAETGDYTGSEFLLQLDSDHYLNRGALFKEQERLSSWTVKLTLAGK